jgi:hydroxymethylpyrimidine/phosphomethylpyrimidine kinase
MTVAGSDSGGNAGIQADLRTFHSYNLHCTTVLTAITAQNPFSVSAIHPIPARFIAAQLDAVLGAYSIASLKTGMLAEASTIEAVADKLSLPGKIAKVVDPVMVATSGKRLIGNDAIGALRTHLLPLATVMTPNIPEAEVLSGIAIDSRRLAHEAAKRLHGEYGSAVLIKGGHAAGDLPAGEDILFDGSEFTAFTLPWIGNPASTHGTGCTLSAAIAAEMALGANLKDAVAGAKKYVHGAISSSYFVGRDCGVLGF